MRKYAAAPCDCTIVGDTKSDFLAAKDNGIESVGVVWGYGKPEELALASRIAATPAEV
jgi:phosphoglycolate phosphatase-like HAD superfamily hydrolase